VVKSGKKPELHQGGKGIRDGVQSRTTWGVQNLQSAPNPPDGENQKGMGERLEKKKLESLWTVFRGQKKKKKTKPGIWWVAVAAEVLGL